MATRRDLIEADDFQRHRTVAALLRGDPREIEEVPRRPNLWLAAGVVVALLVAAASAVTAFLGDRAPDGWNADHSYVIDKQNGGAYVAEGGSLHPAPTLTAALLAGARPQPVLVPHQRVVEAPLGAPIPGSGTPGVPPTVPGPVDPTACITTTGAIDVFARPPATAPSPASGLLVRAFGSDDLALIADRHRFRVDPASLLALGYTFTQVRDVPRAFFDLVPPGADLVEQKPLPAPGGVPGIGAGGQTVASAESGRRYLVGPGVLRPLANQTTARLAPPPTRTLPDAVLAGAPVGPPAGLVDVPTDPPAVPQREEVAVPCVRSSDGLVSIATAVQDGNGTRPSPARVIGNDPNRVSITWHFPPGVGALLGPPGVNAPRPRGSDPNRDEGIILVDAGVGYRVQGDQTLRALGYDRRAVTPLSPGWFALLTTGVPLTARP